MVWSEPGQNPSDVASSCWTMDSYGQWIYTKPRRFIVVRAHLNSCLVVPITSYGEQGVSKPGVKKSDHCIAYTGRVAPLPLHEEAPKPGESGMQPFPIRIDPDELGARLDEASRIDFSRPRTVDHYNLVKNFGKVHPDSMSALLTQFQNVMNPSRTAGAQRQSRQLRLESRQSVYLEAYSALVTFGWSHEKAANFVNVNIQAREAGDAAEDSESEDSERDEGASRSDD